MKVEHIISVVRRKRLRWYGHVKRRPEENWVKKCMEIEVGGANPKGRPKKTWMEVVAKDLKALGLKDDDTLNRSTWRAVININRDRSIFHKPANLGLPGK